MLAGRRPLPGQVDEDSVAASRPVWQADHRHEPTHHMATPLSGQRHNPSCFSSMSQLPPYAQASKPPPPTHRGSRISAGRTHRPTGHGKRPDRSDRHGSESHPKRDLFLDRGTRLAVLWGGVMCRRHILACMTCGDPPVVLMRFLEGGMSRARDIHFCHCWVYLSLQ